MKPSGGPGTLVNKTLGSAPGEMTRPQLVDRLEADEVCSPDTNDRQRKKCSLCCLSHHAPTLFMPTPKSTQRVGRLPKTRTGIGFSANFGIAVNVFLLSLFS